MDENIHVWLFLVFLAHWNVSIMAELRLVRPTIYIYIYISYSYTHTRRVFDRMTQSYFS